jgi:hypothetical protein
MKDLVAVNGNFLQAADHKKFKKHGGVKRGLSGVAVERPRLLVQPHRTATRLAGGKDYGVVRIWTSESAARLYQRTACGPAYLQGTAGWLTTDFCNSHCTLLMHPFFGFLNLYHEPETHSVRTF